MKPKQGALRPSRSTPAYSGNTDRQIHTGSHRLPVQQRGWERLPWGSGRESLP
uniref:GRF3 n=1 Tax=Arundo donax TaxID=35708 RepID=A0A0A9FCB7_ARUDO